MNNLDVRSEYDLMPASLRLLGLRRKLVIVMYVTYLLSTVGFWLLGTMPGIYNQNNVEPWIIVVFGITCFISLGCASWLYASISNVAKAQDKELDERQRIVRDRAYRYAYRTVMVVVVVLLLVRIVLTQGEAIINGPLQSLAVFWGILQLFGTLPTAIIAWVEREV